MGTEIKVWQVLNSKLSEIQDDLLAASHREKDLEEWIERDTSLLGSKLLVIGRQYDIPGVGVLDLLCIEEDGNLVVVEFKRDSTRRDTVAQILDYASWLDTASEEEIQTRAFGYLGKELSDAFHECFGKELKSLTPQKHRMLVVAPKLDSSAERIINYLAERHGMKINAIFFRYAKTAQGDEVLIRTVLVPEGLRRSATETVTIAELLATAKESKTVALVDIFRKLGSVAKEEARPTYGGSFRYWFKDKMVFGINVAGERCSPPNGQLDVWIPVITVSNVVGMSEGTIRQKLKQNFAATESGKTDCIVRVSSPEAANSLVSLVQQWIATPTVGIAAETTASTGP